MGQKLVIPAGGKAVQKPAAKPAAKPAEKPAADTSKPAAKPAAKPVEKPADPVKKAETPAVATQNKNQTSASVEDALSQAIEGIDTNVVEAPAKPADDKAAASSTEDDDVLPVVIDRDMTLEEIASGFGRSLDEVKRLNPQYKSGEKIKSQSTVILPFF